MSRIDGCGGEEGFTFVELMVVILIIGILVSIAVASFAVSVSASKKTACKVNLRIIEEEILVYRCDFGENPATLPLLVPDYIDDEKSLDCPDSGKRYEYDPVIGDVSCPFHTDL